MNEYPGLRMSDVKSAPRGRVPTRVDLSGLRQVMYGLSPQEIAIIEGKG